MRKDQKELLKKKKREKRNKHNAHKISSSGSITREDRKSGKKQIILLLTMLIASAIAILYGYHKMAP